MYYKQRKKKEYKVPDYVNVKCPTLEDFKSSDVYYGPNGEFFLKGIGNKNANIMFLSSCPFEEDVDTESSFSEPRLLKSSPALFFKRLCLNKGINVDNEYFTTVCKYPLPRSYKLKPKSEDIKYCSDLLEEEIKLVSPKIIVCLGKDATNYILGMNIKLSSIDEAWIYSKKYNAMLYIISEIQKAFYKPEYQDKMEKDLDTLSKHYSYLCEGKNFLNNIKQEYKLINNFNDLKSWISKMLIENRTLFAVDCEWGGMTFADGTLRSIQFCWEQGKAVFIQFHNEKLQWDFDVPKEEVLNLLQNFLNRPEVKYIGHNANADMQWMHKHLGLDIFDGKFIFDTMYAMQTVNEYEELKLEKLASKYTDLGRYDVDLLLWKKANKGVTFNEDEGYGSVPTEILYPYGCKDVDTTFRLYPIIKDLLIKDETLDYYNNIKNPFVTEGFAEMSMEGVPFDMEYANKVRIAYLAAGIVMQKLFKDNLKKEAKKYLLEKLQEYIKPELKSKFVECYLKLLCNITLDYESGVKLLKTYVGRNIVKILPFYKHYYYIDTFNPRSSEQKQVWLFDIKGHTPIKTTKLEGGNSIDWAKVTTLPEKEQKEYKPAVDKDTLKIYADAGDELCLHLLEMNAIDQITKSFLKGEEGGLQKYVINNTIHSNYSLTETSRPRSWKPNILNIGRVISNYIKDAFRKVNEYFGIEYDYTTKEYNYDNLNLENFNKIKESIKETYNISEDITIEDLQPKGLRSCFRFKDKNTYFADADLKSAEVVAIAYMGNDKNLINAIEGVDPQYAIRKMEDGTEKKVRIAYIDEIVPLTEDVKDPSLLHDINDPNLLRDENGELIHPARDMHFELVESKYFMNTPREKLDKEIYRNTIGKVANFGIPYGTSGIQLENKIQVGTGKKPKAGTGEKIIDAYMQLKPGCAQFIEKCKSLPEGIGYYQSPSGYKRHFAPAIPDENSNMSSKERAKIVGSIKRQASNVPLQSIVADTLAIAVVKLNRAFRHQNMTARCIIPLYDAVYVKCQKEEINKVHEMIEEEFSKNISWDTPGGKLSFGTDHETTKSWGTPLTDEEKTQLINEGIKV